MSSHENVKPVPTSKKQAKDSKGQAEAASQNEEKLKIEQPQIDYLAEIQEYKDKWMRAAAEAQNIKRRAEQDISKARVFSIEKFAQDLMEVLESLHRASLAISDDQAQLSEPLKNAKEGIEITRKEMVNVFERHGIKRIFPVGEIFNPAQHEAVSQLESADHTSGTIIDVVRAGYILNDRLLRAALVVVAK